MKKRRVEKRREEKRGRDFELEFPPLLVAFVYLFLSVSEIFSLLKEKEREKMLFNFRTTKMEDEGRGVGRATWKLTLFNQRKGRCRCRCRWPKTEHFRHGNELLLTFLNYYNIYAYTLSTFFL